MTILEYKQHIAAGLPVEAGSPAHLFMHAMSQEAIRITMEINNRYHTPEELRALLSELWGIFGTLVKTETERTAKDIINDSILQKAKELLSNSPLGESEGAPLTVTQISQRLGFEYPQHFVRFFKALTGKTPTQWRAA